jgi:lipopolysaccharide transport system ATP-binding protein
MSDIAVRIEHLSKQYQLGGQQARYQTFREALIKTASAPLRWLKGERQEKNIFWALDDVSFEIKHGEAVGIIGRNGAGKSTLLKILSSITTPTRGRVELYGRVGSLLEVGTGFHPELTGRENVFLNGAILGMSRNEIMRKFDEIVGFAEVEKFLDTPVKFYSSGMYVRLAFAVAAHLEPEILVVDEVLAVGDAQFQKKCLGKMGEVAHEGRTVLFVSHQMNAIEQLCTHCIHLDKGKVKNITSDVRSAVIDYLFGKVSNDTICSWQNSGFEHDTKAFRPISLRLVDSHENPIESAIPNNEVVWVEIQGELKIDDPAFTIGYAIFSEDGNLLYWSYQTDTPELDWPKLERGFFTIRSQIPPRFLNEGVYRIELIASFYFREWLLEPGRNAPSVFLTIQGGLSDSPMWIMKRPGLLAPIIQWEVQQDKTNQTGTQI